MNFYDGFLDPRKAKLAFQSRAMEDELKLKYPNDAKRVYLACGTYTNERTPNGAILRSADGGRTFERTDVPFKFGGNEDGRGNGERMVVDPMDGRVLLLGTRHGGLWRSQDRGVSWTRVASFPDVTEAVPPMPVPVAGETPEQRWRRMPSPRGPPRRRARSRVRARNRGGRGPRRIGRSGRRSGRCPSGRCRVRDRGR